ncbi:hypothetical protein FKR81_39235 [Lentzea tibetensis]|uniref:Uncharacterized protein n=1 Tax=Lentzea tibetensis TaxID=2591470 RepID=A0A563EGY1_9PSEU|nr:hypothetical protein [Lentzea tibetensis]TWP45460.1 hypothetical protein FKR81_39235 [Lentzea tibetensis]
MGRKLLDGPLPTKENPPGSLLIHNEEAMRSKTCADQGKLVLSSLKGSHQGESWRCAIFSVVGCRLGSCC